MGLALGQDVTTRWQYHTQLYSGTDRFAGYGGISNSRCRSEGRTLGVMIASHAVFAKCRLAWSHDSTEEE